MRALLAVFALLALIAPASAQYNGRTVDVPMLMVPGPLGEKAMGDPKAPVTIIEYASMTCPHCQRFHAETYPALKSKYIDTGKVYFILREFPLDALAFAAFMVARCSGDHYFDVIDVLFDHQEEWAFSRTPIENLVSFTRPYGIGGAEYDACLDDMDVFDHVDFVASRGYDIFGVEGTPTFFFNGNRVVGEIPVEGIDRIVGSLLGQPN
jgi:protein-disulfide isomerase